MLLPACLPFNFSGKEIAHLWKLGLGIYITYYVYIDLYTCIPPSIYIYIFVTHESSSSISSSSNRILKIITSSPTLGITRNTTPAHPNAIVVVPTSPLTLP